MVQLNNRILQALESSWKDVNNLTNDQFTNPRILDFSDEIGNCITNTQSASRQLVIKDPRICRLLPLWLPVLESCFDHVAVLIIVRGIEDVFESLRHRANFTDTAPAAITSKEHASALWFRYYLDVFHHCQDVSYHVVHYEHLVANSDKITRSIRAYLKETLPGANLISGMH